MPARTSGRWVRRTSGLMRSTSSSPASMSTPASLFLVLTWLGLVPRYLAVAAVARDVMIAGGATLYRMAWGPLHGRPILSSKINTVLQLAYILLVVVHAQWGQPPATMLQALAA